MFCIMLTGNVSHPCQECMELQQKSNLGLVGVFGCGFFAPTTSVGMLLQNPYYFKYYFILHPKYVPVTFINILFETKKHSNLN